MNWKYMLVYLDDIMMYSKPLAGHFVHLKGVFMKLYDADPHQQMKFKAMSSFRQPKTPTT